MNIKGFGKVFENYEPYNKIKKYLKNNKDVIGIDGLSMGAKVHLINCIMQDMEKSSFWVAKNDYEAKKIRDIASFFCENVYYLPEHEFVYYEVYATSEIQKQEQLTFFENFFNEKKGFYIVTPTSFLAPITKKEQFLSQEFYLNTGDRLEIKELIKKLWNYTRCDITEVQGQFSVRGGIVDIFPYTAKMPYRIEFFGDEIDSIRTFDPITKLSENKLSQAYITNFDEFVIGNTNVLAQKIEAEAEIQTNDALKEILQRDVQRLNSGEKLYSYDRYFPLIKESLGYINDYVNDEFIVVADEVVSLYDNFNAIYKEHMDYLIDLCERGSIIKSNLSFFSDPVENFRKLYNNSVVHFGFINLSFGEIKPTKEITIPTKSVLSSQGSISIFVDEINDCIDDGYFVLIPGRTREKAEKLSYTLSNYEINAPVITDFSDINKGVSILPCSGFTEGFSYPELKFVFFSDIYEGINKKKRKIKEQKNENAIVNFSDLTIGDNVVHPVHGIGVYLGVTRLKIENEQKDLIKIKYRGSDYLYIPVNQLDTLYKYVGDESSKVKLNKLGGIDFDKVKKRVKQSCEDLADYLTELYKTRESAVGFCYSEDTDMQVQFERTFPYEETQDQLNCIYEVKKDMESHKPMDRLVCGDVGYGKTEIALRAAFKAVCDNKQVAYLAPTTILAKQHYNTFTSRMKDFPVKIGLLSRFCTPKDVKNTIKGLKNGSCDIVIGTHRLLSKDVEFKDLGLLIVDEEQRFGVKHKEKIKEMKAGVDILTLSATPIPRTLNMAMVGIRDVSTLKEPPCDRHPIRTFVLEYNENIICDAIKKELSRNGQVFYLYNRVESIYSVSKKLSEFFPDSTIAVAHGKLSRNEMEDIFYKMSLGEVDILVCTTIIETGLDIPNVNTIIIENADCFGLSQLYQLRGRVGRSSRLAYCYLTYRQNKSVSQVSEKRLKAIKEFTEFGSGFKIAIRDLEIRGAGNILGSQQHGHMDAVGYDMYLKLLDEALREKRGEKVVEKITCQVDLKVSAFIGEKYISDHNTKIEIYKKISLIESKEDLEELSDELKDRFSDIPRETVALMEISYIRALCERLNIFDVSEMNKVVTFKMSEISNEFVTTVLSADRRYKGKILFGAGSKPYFTIKLLTMDKTGELILFLEKIL